MYFRFKISNKKFFEDNPECKAIKIFNEIGEEAMKFMALTYAYNSPLKNLELQERKYEAIKESGMKKTPQGRPSKLETDLIEGRTQLVLDVKKKFMELQYNDAYDTFEAYEIQLAEFRQFMRKRDKDEKELARSLQIAKMLPDFLDNKNIIAEKLNLDEAIVLNHDDDIDDDGDFSAIEEFHAE